MDPTGPIADGQLLHATCVAASGRGVLITGQSGTGKSSLALQLIAAGAKLVADDQTLLRAQGGALIASAPDTIAGRIEARALGILRLMHEPKASVVMAITLDHKSEERLPPHRSISYLGVEIPLHYGAEHPGYAAAVLLLLTGDGTLDNGL